MNNHPREKVRRMCLAFAVFALSCAHPLASAQSPAWSPEEFLYTPADIKAMRERYQNEPKDGPLHELVAGGDRWLSKLTPEHLEKLLPEGIPVHGGYPAGTCPACGKAGPRWQGRSWGRMECPQCKTAFPNEKHPDTETVDLGGRVYRYSRDEKGNVCNRSGSARYWQTNWTMKHDRPYQYLAVAYMLTGDKRYARAAANVIVRYSKNWLKWPLLKLRRDATGLPRLVTLDTMRKGPGYYGKLQWLDDSVLLTHVAFAYGAIRPSGAVTDAEHKLILNMAREALELNTIPHLFYKSHGYGNMHYTMYAAMIMAGRALGTELVCRDVVFKAFTLNGVDLIHEAYDGPKGAVYACLNMVGREGCYIEGTGAYYAHLRHFTQPLIFANGYIDPPGYKPSPRVAAYYRGRHRLEPARDVDLKRMIEFYGIMTRGLVFPALNDSDVGSRPRAGVFLPYYLLSGSEQTKDAIRALVPKGPVRFYEFNIYALPTLKDTRYASIWDNKEPVEFPLFSGVKSNFGLGVMRGSGKTDLYLSWDGFNSSHCHYEQLGIVLYADTHEALLDFGYMGSSARLRYVWMNRTIAHNTVTVDEDVQKTIPRGQLERWGDFGAVRICQASDQKAFAGLKQYRRTIALIDRKDKPAYCLDLFEVEGGKTHDQSWLGNGKLLSIEGPKLTPRKGTMLGENTKYGDKRLVKDMWRGDRGNAYGYINELTAGECPASGWSGVWQIENSPMKLRLLAASAPGDTLIRGACPYERVRSKDHHGSDTPGMKGPIVIVRRKAKKGAALSSIFATAIEPYGDESDLAGVQRPPSGRGIEAAYRSNPQRRDSLELDGNGAITYLSREGNSLRELVLIGRAGWKGLGWEVTIPGSPAAEGTILAVNSDDTSLLLDAPLPLGQALAGQFISAWNSAGVRSQFTVKSVARDGVGCRVFVDKSKGAFGGHIGLVDKVIGPRTFESGSYFRSGAWGRMYPGNCLLIGEKSYRIAEVTYADWKRRNRVTVTLQSEAFKDKTNLGKQFVVSAVAPGDRWKMDFPVHVVRDENLVYHVTCPVKVSVRTPRGVHVRN